MLKINEVSNHRKIRMKQVLKEKGKFYVMNQFNYLNYSYWNFLFMPIHVHNTHTFLKIFLGFSHSGIIFVNILFNIK